MCEGQWFCALTLCDFILLVSPSYWKEKSLLTTIFQLSFFALSIAIKTLQYWAPRKRPCYFNLYGMNLTTCQIEENHKAQNSIRHPLVRFNGLHRRFTTHEGSVLVLRWWTTSQHPTECVFVPKSLLTCPTHPQGKRAKASLFQPKQLNRVPGYQMRTKKQTRKFLWTLSTLFHLYWLWENPQVGWVPPENTV